MASGTPPAWGRAWWRSTLRTLTARSSPRIGMPLPNAPKSRVRRRPLARSEWAALRPAPSSECAVRAPERRWPRPPIARLLSSAFVRPWLSGGARDQERRGPPVALVGGAVRRPQPLLLVHGAEDDVEGNERREGRAVRRHAGQEQKEPEGSQVA